MRVVFLRGAFSWWFLCNEGPREAWLAAERRARAANRKDGKRVARMTRSKRTEQREKAKKLLGQATAAGNQREAEKLIAKAMEVLEITADSPGAEQKIRNLMNEVQKEHRRQRDPDDHFIVPSDASWNDGNEGTGRIKLPQHAPFSIGFVSIEDGASHYLKGFGKRRWSDRTARLATERLPDSVPVLRLLIHPEMEQFTILNRSIPLKVLASSVINLLDANTFIK